MRRRLVVVLLAMIVLIASGANAASTTTITWHGHAAFEIGTPNGVVILIDPWLMTPALHSSGLGNPFAKDREEEPELATGGNAAGFVLQIRNGPTIYHSGDTAYFKDMEIIGEQYAPDVALLNIGGHFGMEPAMAARAAASVRGKLVIPMHFGTFPVLTQDTTVFRQALKEQGLPFRQLHPGETIAFEGKKIKPAGE